MRAGWLVTPRGEEGMYPVRGALPREQPQGLKFPTPGVVLLFGLHLSSAALQTGTSAIQ